MPENITTVLNLPDADFGSGGFSNPADNRVYILILGNTTVTGDPDGFRLWLLERGNRLLQGTSAYRPTFPVE